MKRKGNVKRKSATGAKPECGLTVVEDGTQSKD
jgi:hypothetical protein